MNFFASLMYDRQVSAYINPYFTVDGSAITETLFLTDAVRFDINTGNSPLMGLFR